MSIVQVDYDRREYVTREAYPNDNWDNDCTAAEIRINGIRVGDKAGYRDFEVGFDVVPGEKYWLLWADYGTGDSFGSYDNIAEFIDLFIDFDQAEAARKALMEQTGYTRGYMRQGQNEAISIHVPWEGYFEHLNELHVERVECIGRVR